VGHYRVLEKIGAGAMGEVFRARDERLDRYVALEVDPARFRATIRTICAASSRKLGLLQR
jgi:hypothetical protein